VGGELNSPREPRGVVSSFEGMSVKSHTEDLLVNFEDKLQGDSHYRLVQSQLKRHAASMAS